jgi:plasmid stability protein
MPDVLVRNVDEVVLERLKARAHTEHRSLQAELQLILTRAATQLGCDEIKSKAAKLRTLLDGREHTDSANLLAEDRAR